MSALTRTVLVVAGSAMLLAGCVGTASTALPSAPTSSAPTSRPTSTPAGTPAGTPTSAPASSTSAAPWPAGITAHPAGSEGNEIGVLSYLPPGYGDADEAWPLLVFLHGYLESGDGSEAQLRNLLSGPELGIPQLIEAGEWPGDLPFIVVMPQYAEFDAQHCELGDEIASVIEWADLTYRVDPARVYLTGLSCGAIGVWDYLASAEENRVAATVPISSEPAFAMAKAGCDIASTPMWAFHGALDETVPVHDVEEAVAALRACTDPPPSQIRLTVYPEANHDAWIGTYDGSAGHDIYAWMLKHTGP